MTLISKPIKLTELPPTKPAIAEASAGTGKTFLLENIVVDLIIERGLAPAQILLLTFAKAAADQLRFRVAGAIEEILTGKRKPAAKGTPSWRITDEIRTRLERALLTLGECTMGTIHSFYNRLLSEHSFSIGLPPTVIPEVDGSATQHAVREALRLDLPTRDDVRPYYEMWLNRGTMTPSDLVKTLAKIADMPRPILPVHNPALTLDLVQQARDFKLPSNWKKDLKPGQIGLVEEIKGLLGELPKSPVITDALLLRDKIAGSVEQLIVEDIKLPPAPVGNLLALCVRLARETPPADSACIQVFSKCVESRLKALQWSTGGISFHDMVALVDRAGDRGSWPAVAERLRRTYEFGMLDEFQDTDSHQWNVFKRLFLEGVGAPTLCAVGDPKQSIYSFRGANIHTYFGAKETVKDADGTVISLLENHRASAAMIKACNTLFGGKPKRFFAWPIEYANVECGNETITAVKGDKALTPVVLGVLEAPGNGLNKTSLFRDVGQWISGEIESLVGDPKIEFSDGKDPAPRPFKYSDVLILTFRKEERKTIQKWLTLRGIPSIIDGSDNALLATDEAADVLHLLLAIQTPFYPAAYRGAWITPFFGVPIDRLQAIAGTAEERQFQDRLTAWRVLAEARQFHRLFTSIMSDTRVICKDIKSGVSERRLTNYLHIFEILRRHAATTGGMLDSLIDLLSSGGDSEDFGDFETGVPKERRFTDSDAVRIMTVHRSKGLQAPIVFLFGGFTTGDGFNPDLGIVNDQQVWHVSPDSWIQERIKTERLAEWQRLLYVAMTRAQVRLYIPKPTSWSKYHNGQMELVFQRINDLIGEKLIKEPEFGVVDVPIDAPIAGPSKVAAKAVTKLTKTATPTPAFGPGVNEVSPVKRRAEHEATFITSYTQLAKKQPVEREEPTGGDDEEDPLPVVPEAPKSDKPVYRGAAFGVFVHTIIERVPLSTYLAGEAFETWAAKPAVAEILERLGKAFGFDAEGTSQGAKLAHAGMTSPVTLPGGAVLKAGIASAERSLTEGRMLFPYPTKKPGAPEGLVTGAIDHVFLHKGRVYFTDWKTDSVMTPGEAALADGFKKYEIQVMLYTLAVVKALRIKDETQYDRIFGGHVYCFLRRMAEGVAPGVTSGRLTWSELTAFEEKQAAGGRP